MVRPAGTLPVARGAAAVPGAGAETEHLGDHAGGLERARRHVDQHRDRLDMLLHRTGAVEQEAHRRMRHRLDTVGAEQPALGRRGDQLRQPAAVDAAFLLRAVPAVDGGRGQQGLPLPRQARHVEPTLGDACVELLTILAQLLRPHQAGGLHFTVVGGSEDAVVAAGFVEGAAAFGAGDRGADLELGVGLGPEAEVETAASCTALVVGVGFAGGEVAQQCCDLLGDGAAHAAHRPPGLRACGAGRPGHGRSASRACRAWSRSGPRCLRARAGRVRAHAPPAPGCRRSGR
jgi:hypothetical protein